MLAHAAQLPFAEAEFSVVSARHMLYHVSEPAAAIREAHRVLRLGGWFVAVVNFADTLPLTRELLRTVTARYGIDLPAGSGRPRVHAQSLQALIEPMFGDAEPNAPSGRRGRRRRRRRPGGRSQFPTLHEHRSTATYVAPTFRGRSRVERVACSTWLRLSARRRPVPVLRGDARAGHIGAQRPAASTPHPGAERSHISAGTEARTQAGTVSRSV